MAVAAAVTVGSQSRREHPPCQSAPGARHPQRLPWPEGPPRPQASATRPRLRTERPRTDARRRRRLLPSSAAPARCRLQRQTAGACRQAAATRPGPTQRSTASSRTSPRSAAECRCRRPVRTSVATTAQTQWLRHLPSSSPPPPPPPLLRAESLFARSTRRCSTRWVRRRRHLGEAVRALAARQHSVQRRHRQRRPSAPRLQPTGLTTLPSSARALAGSAPRKQ